MAYFRTSYTKEPDGFHYAFFKVEGNEQEHLKTLILPRKLHTQEKDQLLAEIKRLYTERQVSTYNPQQDPTHAAH